MDFFIFIFIIFLFFINFFKIFKKIKILPRVKLTSCHVVVTVSRGSDNAMCHYLGGVIFSFSIWSLYFIFCLNLVPIFVKIMQFRPLQIETKIIKCYTNILLNDFFIQINIFNIYFQ